VSQVHAETHTSGLPLLSSNPSAPYTIYLDFAGFNFSGQWGDSGKTPGNTQAYGGASATGSFTTSQKNEIKEVWARVAQCYTPFNINVTTLDPAIAAGQASTDAQRQAYYDHTARMMHTVIGAQTNNWYGDAGGVSYIGVAQNTWAPGDLNGFRTNWIFTDHLSHLVSRGQAAAHENGHALDLLHQSDFNGGTKVSEYSHGNGTKSNPGGNGSIAPIMGSSYYTQRGEWRVGDDSDGGIQNDVSILLSNDGIGGYVDDGIGHSMATATPLPFTGSSVDPALAKGIITPLSTASPTPIGVTNYTRDYFLFRTNGGQINLTVYDGSEFLTTGTADPGAMLRSTLRILNNVGAVVGTGTEASSTLSETYSGTLPAGDYYAEIASYGGQIQMLPGCNTTNYYDMGSFFMKGSGSFLPVPEPAVWAMLASVACLGAIAFRRTRRAKITPIDS
jgi:hypothetical protein